VLPAPAAERAVARAQGEELVQAVPVPVGEAVRVTAVALAGGSGISAPARASAVVIEIAKMAVRSAGMRRAVQILVRIFVRSEQHIGARACIPVTAC